MIPITIAGGGLAGLTLGILLRQHNVPAAILESGHYPRHRVCGEFISGNGLSVLDRIGLRASIETAGARAGTASFIIGPRRSPVRTLPSPAVCISRHTLDALLAREFRRLGGDLRENTRWTPAADAEGIVRATGRRPVPGDSGGRWFGLKVHARNVPVESDVEMHVFRRGYVGVNRINDAEVNVCGLFRASRNPDTGPTGPPAARMEWFREQCGDTLRDRLKHARFDPASLCAVGGLSLAPRRAIDSDGCCIGDAVTMIPPVTGNGMSMALESAAFALDPLFRYSSRDLSWTECRQEIAAACDRAFARRLAWARALQWLIFSPLTFTAVGAALLKSDALWNAFLTRTR